MNFSFKLDPTMPSFQYEHDVSVGFEWKCVKSLDDDQAIFDDVLSTFKNLFNKREYDKFLKNQDYKGAIMIKPHITNQLCFEGIPPRERESFSPSFINRNLRIKIKGNGGKNTSSS